MTTHSINDYITNIKTFQEYLDHIVDSVESDRYHIDTIRKISDLISKYYSEVNYDDDDVEVVDAEGYDSNIDYASISPVCGSDSDTSNESERSRKKEITFCDDNSENSKESEKSKVSKSSKNSKNRKNGKNENIDRYVFEFGNGKVDNKDLLLYKKNPELVQISNNYLNYKY